jgi:DNA invertase Pin-like site-specific DNA recombinase
MEGNERPREMPAPAHSGQVRAAQYVRMSTEQQKYSIDNQADAISRYADHRGMVIVRSYEDAGKSGLNLEGRAGLRQLLQDVQEGRSRAGPQMARA